MLNRIAVTGRVAPGSGEGLPAAEVIAGGVRAGDVRAADIFDRHVARHTATASRLNALVQPRHEAARAEAVALDTAIATGRGAGPLAGVPVSVKECFPIRGLVTSIGIESRRGAVDDADADIVTRLRAAGAVIVGKANVPQAMYLHETDNPVWGRTCHPFDPQRNPGGSSGGDAALVAAGVVPLAVGNDLAGSLRQPAHACGVAAIMPRTAALGEGGGFDTLPTLRGVRPRAGFIAGTVADLALASAAVGIPTTMPAAAPLRVGWWDDAGPVAASPAIRRGVREAVARLRAAGAEIVPLDGGIATEAAWLHFAILAADGGADVRSLFAGSRPIPGVARLLAIAGMPRWLRPVVAAAATIAGSRLEARALRVTGPRSREEFAKLLARRDALALRFAAVAEGCAAVVAPVSALPALRHGSAARLILAAAPCLLANLLDLPAGAVPVTRVDADEERGRPWSLDPVLRAAAATDAGSCGLPVGVQVVGGPGRDEATVLHVMRLIEQAGDVSPAARR